MESKDTAEQHQPDTPEARASMPPVSIEGTTPGVINQQKPPASKKKIILLVAGIVLVAIAGLLVSKNMSKTDTKKSASNQTSQNSTESGRVLCVKLGIKSLQCEDLNTKELKKYTLPPSLGDTGNFKASPNGKKFFISTRNVDASSVEQLAVYDAQLKNIAKLPVTQIEGYGNDINNPMWFDNDSMIYTKATGKTEPKTKIYKFSTMTSKEELLIEVNGTIERFMPAGNKYLYGIEPYIDTAQNSTLRKLVVINLETKTKKDVQTSVEYPFLQDIAYSQESSRFYINILKQKEQKFNLKIYKIENVDTNPKLLEVTQIDNTYALGSGYAEVVITNHGLLGTDTLSEMSAPIKLYAETGKITELTLGVGSSGGAIILSLPNFPDFPKADTNEAVISDFYVTATGTPDKIDTFLKKLVTGAPDCKKGEYLTLKLDTYDGDAQFSVSEAGCGRDALFFYKADQNMYKQIAATQEGLACSRRDELGISAVVFPGCRKPGEGL